ncbi:dynamin family protein [Halobacillus litoralis]|uniref:dynamin family protein n=1 Tax=Halobacillus litoralis TaxID=45668 RepID=UPI001CFDFF71|nr:dynamin family protein [Halobacillus litoralis]
MSFSIDHYIKLVNRYDHHADRLLALLEGMNDQVKKTKLETYRDELKYDPFTIAVVGEFGRGKSMFINALLGEKILPSSTKVTTTILNHISYGERSEIVLHFHDGTEKVITQEEFKQLVAPMEPYKGDVQSEKEYEEAVAYIQTIAYANVRYPIAFCKDGVRIIDTPGLNDGNEARDQIASEIIPRSDVAIMLLTAKAPLSASEMTMLKDRLLDQDIQKVFIVANFKDALRTEKDEEEVVGYIKNNLKEVFEHPKVHLVSAKQALTAKRLQNGEKLRVRNTVDLEETGIPAFEEALADFLQYDRGKVKLKRPVQKSIRLIDQVVTQDLAVEKSALYLETEVLNQKVEKIRSQLVVFEQSGAASLAKIKGFLQKKEQVLVRWYKDELADIKKEVLHTFDAAPSLNGIEEKVERKLAQRERQLHKEKVEKMQALTKEIVELGSKTLNSEWKEIEGSFEELTPVDETALSVQFQAMENSFDMFREIYEELDIAWGRSTSFFGKAAVGVGFVINTFFAGVAGIWDAIFGKSEAEKRKEARRKFSTDLTTSQTKKLEAMKKEWKAVIKGTETNYRKIVNNQTKEKEQQLNTIERKSDLEKSEIDQRLNEINVQQTTLQEIKKAFYELDDELEMDSRKEVLA